MNRRLEDVILSERSEAKDLNVTPRDSSPGSACLRMTELSTGFG